MSFPRLTIALLASSFLVLTGCSSSTSTPTTTTPPPPATAQLSTSTSSLAFSSVVVGQTSPSQTVTLSSTGGLGVTVSAITLSDVVDYSMTNNCTAQLNLSTTCTITVSFNPASAASLPATISISSNSIGSPQTINLTGTGTASSGGTPTITRTLYVFPATFPAPSEPDASVSALYTLVNNAHSTVDMTMYELQDTTFSGDLVADCARGVRVRVILSSSETSSNTPAFTQLNSAGANCSAVFSNTAFTNTHQKTITVDDTTTAIMSLNLQTQYYTTTRDFALIENDPADIAAIEATFSQDYAAGTPNNGVSGASDFNYSPGGGDTTLHGLSSGDLIWSPTTAQADMLSLINNAQSTILLENEEMSASNIVSALETACQSRRVTVQIAMVNDSDYASEFSALEAAGCGVHVYPDTTTGFYVHAKAVVADYGLSTQAVYMGSINYSNASMTENRELGIYITDPTAVATLETTMAADYAGGTAY